MNTRFLILSAFLFAASAQASERRYALSDFDKIQVIGSQRVIVTTARATQVQANGPREAIDALSVEVQDRVLTIQTINNATSAKPVTVSGSATVLITLPLLSEVRLRGAATINIAEMRGLEASISLIGSGTITVARIGVDRLSARLSGSGALTLTGKSKSVIANIKGSGNLMAGSLIAADLKLTAASSGQIVAAAQRSANVVSNGAGNIEIVGKPSCTIQNSGAGTITCGKSK